MSEGEKLVAADPSDQRAKLELADYCVRNDDPARAIALYHEAGEAYSSHGNGLKAMAVYLQIVRLEPKDRAARLALARQYAEHGLMTDAVAHLSAAFETLSPSDSSSARLEVLATALDLDAENVGGRVRLAEAYSAAGQLQDTVAQLRMAALALEAHDADQDFQLVGERLLYHDPQAAGIARSLAASYVAQDAPQQALPKLKIAFAHAPNDLEVLGLMAETFNQLGQIHKAIAVLKEMARLYDHNGLVTERDECFSKVLMLDPNDASAREALGGTSQDAVGTTIELSAPTARSGPALGPTPGTSSARLDDFEEDDFDFDFDDDEIGFGGKAENTIVDDAFIPEDVGVVAGAGLSLDVPSASPGAPSSGALQDDLRELDFYLNNGLADEAAALLGDLVVRHGPHPSLDQRAQQIAQLRG